MPGPIQPTFGKKYSDVKLAHSLRILAGKKNTLN